MSVDVKLRKLRIKNFQTIEEITIVFEKSGAYHLIGDNNIGKSAILKAIATLFKNASRNIYKEYIRDDMEFFEVEGHMWDGSWLFLSRGLVDFYEYKLVTGQHGRLDKTDGKMPEEVVTYLNLYEDNEKTKQNLNLRLVDDLKLFVQTSEGDNYYLLQRALRTEEFLSALKLASKEKRELSGELKVTEQFYTNEKNKFNKIKEEYLNSTNDLERMQDLMKIINAEYESYLRIEDIISTYKEIGILTNELKEEEQFIISDKELKLMRKELNLLQKVEDLIVVFNELKTLADDYKSVKQQLTDINLDSLKQELKMLKKIEQLINLQEELDDLEGKLSSENIIIEEFNNTIKPEMTQYLAIVKVVKANKELSEMVKEYKQVDEEYKNADKDLGDFMRENKFCPIVAKTIDKQCPFKNAV